MSNLKADLSNLESTFPKDFTPDQIAKAKTAFYKKLALLAHSFYGGKIQVVPRAPVPGFNWFNVWYTPGVSNVSTSIRDNNELSFSLSSRGNMVAVVSDSTRVLGERTRKILMPELKYPSYMDGMPAVIEQMGILHREEKAA